MARGFWHHNDTTHISTAELWSPKVPARDARAPLCARGHPYRAASPDPCGCPGTHHPWLCGSLWLCSPRGTVVCLSAHHHPWACCPAAPLDLLLALGCGPPSRPLPAPQPPPGTLLLSVCPRTSRAPASGASSPPSSSPQGLGHSSTLPPHPLPLGRTSPARPARDARGAAPGCWGVRTVSAGGLWGGPGAELPCHSHGAAATRVQPRPRVLQHGGHRSGTLGAAPVPFPCSPPDRRPTPRPRCPPVPVPRRFPDLLGSGTRGSPKAAGTGSGARVRSSGRGAPGVEPRPPASVRGTAPGAGHRVQGHRGSGTPELGSGVTGTLRHCVSPGALGALGHGDL